MFILVRTSSTLALPITSNEPPPRRPLTVGSNCAKRYENTILCFECQLQNHGHMFEEIFVRKSARRSGKWTRIQSLSLQETHRRRLWIFCRLRPSASVPPCILKRGVKLVTAVNTLNIAVTTASMLRSMWYEFRAIYEIKK